jgi:GxxExxY protein
MNTEKVVPDRLAERVIGCVLTVSNTLGIGFLEKVYENALAHELRKAELSVAQQAAVTVQYDGIVVGEYAADIVVNNLIILELKVVSELSDIHRAQCLNYLRATGLRLCLLINFGKPRPEIKRLILGY